MVTMKSGMRTIAVALGVLIGIYAAECGRDNMHAQDTYSVVARIRHQDTYDTQGIQFFAIVMPDGEALLSVDGDLELAKQVLTRKDARVRITVEPFVVQELVR
jgi:hypothetical protein